MFAPFPECHKCGRGPAYVESDFHRRLAEALVPYVFPERWGHLQKKRVWDRNASPPDIPSIDALWDTLEPVDLLELWLR